MTRRVLIFSLAYVPHIGGAEIAIREITDRMPDIEWHMVTLRLGKEPKEERIGNVVVHRIGFGDSAVAKGLYQFQAALVGLRLHARYRFDLVWAMMAHTAGVPAALFTLVHRRMPYLLTLQEGDPPQEVERTMRAFGPLFTRAFTRANAVQAISSFLGEWARRRGVRDVRVIPNGVDVAHFSQAPNPEAVATESARIGTKPDHTYLVTTSRVVHKNALDDVIRALPMLPAVTHFVVYGVGPDEAMLRALTKELGVIDRVHFMGQISHERMPAALAACDIFVRPSRSEGMGNSFIEAMAAGLPVIGTQEGGIADFLFDAKRNPDKPTTGWAVDADAPEQIARAIVEIETDLAATRAVTQTAQALVTQKYDWTLVTGHMRALFDELMGSR